MKFIQTYIIILLAFHLNGQNKSDYTWIFASNPSSIPGVEGSIISFDGGSRSIEYEVVTEQIGSIHAQICDSETGRLLIYSNGCVVLDSTHVPILGGEEINAGEVHDIQCDDGKYTGLGDSAILPDPGNENGYYLFQKRLEYNYEPVFDVYAPGLQFSYIDLSLNDGKGEVTKVDIEYFKNDTMIDGYFEPILHANGRDWWFIQMQQDSNMYFKFLLDESGVSVVDTQFLGSNFHSNASAAGDAVFSPDGTKYLFYNPDDDLLVYDFDRSTGMLSNLRRVYVDDDGFFTGIAVSPSGQYAYLSSSFDLWQVDLWSSDLQESLFHIATYDGFADPLPTKFHLAQLAPDCKIYITSTSTVKYLHVINEPDNYGTACNFVQRGVELPFNHGNGSIPNVPYFRIDEEEICDPTITNVFDFPVGIDRNIKIYPNPTSDEIQFNGVGDFISMDLTSISGVSILKYEFFSQENLSVQLPDNILPGIYFLRFLSKDRQSVMKKLVVTR